MNVLVTALLSDHKLKTKLMGLNYSDRINKIILVRKIPLAGLEKIQNINPVGIWGKTKVLYEIWRLYIMLKYILTEKLDVLIGIQLQLHGLVVAFVGCLTRCPSVIQVIGSDIYLFLNNPWKKPFISWTLRHSDAVIILGSDSKRILRSLGVHPERIHEIQNYQDEARFFDRSMEKRFDLLFVGGLIPRKRLKNLIEVIPEVISKIGPIKVGILGDGCERNLLEEHVKNLGLSDCIEFLGYSNEVDKFLNASKVFIMVSYAEGMPAAAVEAMFCGLPVILTDVGNIRDIFDDKKNAIIIKLGDRDALVEAIVRVLADNEVYKKLQAGALESRANYISRWSIDKQSQGWLNVIDHAVSK